MGSMELAYMELKDLGLKVCLQQQRRWFGKYILVHFPLQRSDLDGGGRLGREEVEISGEHRA